MSKRPAVPSKAAVAYVKRQAAAKAIGHVIRNLENRAAEMPEESRDRSFLEMQAHELRWASRGL